MADAPVLMMLPQRDIARKHLPDENAWLNIWTNDRADDQARRWMALACISGMQSQIRISVDGAGVILAATDVLSKGRAET
jgi:hypothetical protein